jgi:hypothetical protein
MTDAFVISRLTFLVAVGLASFAGSAVLGRLLVKQPERLRVALWWLLAVIRALSCAWVSGGWSFPPRESQHWIGYVLLFAALLRSIHFPTDTTDLGAGQRHSRYCLYSASDPAKWLGTPDVWQLFLRQSA